MTKSRLIIDGKAALNVVEDADTIGMHSVVKTSQMRSVLGSGHFEVPIFRCLCCKIEGTAEEILDVPCVPSGSPSSYEGACA